LTAKAAFVGIGDAAGIAGRDLTGQIAVADRGTLTFAEKYDSVRRAGAAGLIVVNTEDGDLLGTIYKDGDIPMAGVGRADRATLSDAIAAGKPVTIEVPPPGKTTAINVIARPARGAECRVIVGGHHDTVPSAPGAHDNASGVAETLELARAFAADGLDAGLCFATFGAEESGLFGSQALAKDLASRSGLPRAMVNLDMVGMGRQVSLIGTPELVGPALTKAQELGIDAAAVTLGFAFGSDHQTFEKAGVPVLAFATDDLGKFHTPQDTAEAVSLAMLDSSGRLAYAVIAQLLQRVAQG
jgi:aminopeptidase YwaD